MKKFSLGLIPILFLAACATPPPPQPSTLPAVAALNDEILITKYGIPWERIPFAPAATYQKSPIYPYMEYRAREGQQVKVTFSIDRDGRVADLACFDYTNSAFQSATIKALYDWRFPKVRGGPYRMVFDYEIVPEGASIIWK